MAAARSGDAAEIEDRRSRTFVPPVGVCEPVPNLTILLECMSIGSYYSAPVSRETSQEDAAKMWRSALTRSKKAVQELERIEPRRTCGRWLWL